MTFTEVLNTIIPIGVILIFIALLYGKLKDVVDPFFKMIWHWLLNLVGGINTSEIVIYK